MRLAPRSLRRILTSQLLLVGLAPLTLVGLIITLLVWPRMEADMADRSRRLAEAIRGQVTLFLAVPEQTLHNLAGVLVSRRPNDERITELLDINVDDGEVFEAIYLVGSNGTVEAVGLPPGQRRLRDNYIGLDVSRRRFIESARIQGRQAWSDTFLSILGGGISLGLAVPIGEQVLVGDFNLDHLSVFMASLGRGEGLLPMVVDSEGHVIAHPDVALGRQQLNVANLPLVERALNGETGVGAFEFAGQQYVGTTALIQGRRWVAVVAEDQRVARHGFDATLYALLAAALAATLAAVLLAVDAARRLARPFHDFSAQARALATGRYDLRFEPNEVAEITAMAQSFSDMATNLREREERLSASERQYRQVVEGTDDLITRVDNEGRFTFVNGAGARIFGIPPAQLRGRSAFEFIHPDDREGTQQAFEAWSDSGAERFSHENRQVGIDGCVRDMLWTISADRDEHGRVTGMAGIARDISARKRDEDELRGQQALIERAAAEERVLVRFSRLSLQSLSLEEFLYGALQRLVERLAWMPMEARGAIILFDSQAPPRIAASLGLDEEVLERAVRVSDTTPPPPGMRAVDIASGERLLGRILLSVKSDRPLDGRDMAFLARIADIIGLGILWRQAENETEHLALHDALTGLANRRLLLDRVEQELNSARRGHDFSALLCLDLDHFKTLNDSLGHSTGDLLLREIAERLRQRARAEDTVARLGGDEFVVLLPSLSSSREWAGYRARTIADEVRARLSAPVDLGGHHHHVTASIGIVVFPDGVDESGDLLRKADVARYSAKADGRDTVSFFRQSMQVAADARLRLNKEVRAAIDQRQVEDALAKMRTLKALGVRIAVDDFGTGYSSLAYLRSYPIDELKIDRSFVGDILIDANDAAIVDTVLAMATRLSLRCVAEGVESHAQLDSLVAMGCREFQGLLFSPPLPAEEFAALCQASRAGHDGQDAFDTRHRRGRGDAAGTGASSNGARSRP